MTRPAYLPTVLSIFLAVSILSLTPVSLLGTSSAHATSSLTSWNPNIPCTPLVVRITDITANQTGLSSFNSSSFTPGITTSVAGGEAKRWLTPGSTPSGWHSPGPPCTVTNSHGTTSLFVQINGLERTGLTSEDNSTRYDPTNGGGPHLETFDTTFNLFDPTIVPKYSTSCTSPADPTCYGRIHAEIDHDWKAAGYCGTGSACDNNTLASQTSATSTRIDVQGFIFWDPDNLNANWHQFSGWEIHPLTAWKPTHSVSISWSPVNPQVGQLVTFTATASNGTTPSGFNWSFGDGATASGKTASHMYVAPETFTVQVTMAETDGTSATAQNAVPIGSWNPAAACAPAPTSLEGVLGNISIQRIPTNVNSTGADYSGGGFRLDGTLPYGSNPTTWPFFKRDLQIPCSVNGTPTLVEFHNVTVTNVNKGDCSTKYSIDNGGGSYPNGWQSCDITFSLVTPGFGNDSTCPKCYFHRIYSGIDRDWNASGIAPLQAPLEGQRIDVQGFVYWNDVFINASWHSYTGWEIHPLTAWRTTRPTITVTASFTPSTPTIGQTVTFNGTATGGTGPYEFSWDFGDGTVSTGNPASHAYALGSYTVHMSANDSRGNVGVTSQTLTVVQPPDFTISASPGSLSVVVESTRTANISLSSAYGFAGNVTLATLSPAGITTALNPKSLMLLPGGSAISTLTLSPSAPGNYTVQVTGINGSLSHSANVTVRVTDAPPTVAITTSTSNTFRDQPVTLSIITGDPDGTVTSLKVYWGDGTVDILPANATNDSHSYVKSGSFTVNVTATDNGGKSASSTTSITVTDAPPTISFTASPTTASTGQAITLSVISQDPDGTITQTVVDWGDGTVHTLTGAATADTHAYSNTGNAKSEAFTVTVIVTDNATLVGSNTAPVTINDLAPTPSFTSSATSTSTGVSIIFNATGSSDPDGTISAYSWSFGDGATATGMVVSHVYAGTDGSLSRAFNVTLTITDNSGNSGTNWSLVTVSDRPPVVSFTMSASSALTGVNLSFNATATGDPDGTVLSYAWAFGDGSTGTGVVISHNYTSIGNSLTENFSVTLTVIDNSGNSANATSQVTITDRLPTASYTQSSSSTLTGASITFNATASNDLDGTITTYSWSFGDGSSATGRVVTHSYTSTGNAKTVNFAVTLTVTDNSGNTGSTANIETIIDRSPTAAFTSSEPSTLTDVSVTFNAAVSIDPDGTIANYTWTFGDGGTGTGALVAHTFANTGNAGTMNYTVTLTITDNSGNTGTATANETITDRSPTPSFTSSEASALTGADITFNATESIDPDGTITTYSWSFGDGGTGTGAVTTHAYTSTGSTETENFTITLTVTDNSGNTATFQSAVTIIDRGPLASFTASPQAAPTGVSIIFNATASSDPDGTVTAYVWSFGDGATATGMVVSHIYASTDSSPSRTFNVILNVTDNSGNTVAASLPETVNDRPPVASFTLSSSSVLTGVSVSFNGTASSDPDGTVLSYVWAFGDGSTATGVVASHNYTSTGNSMTEDFRVTLTVVDNSGNSANATSLVSVSDRLPEASFTESSSLALTDASITFNATASNDTDGAIAAYSWSFGDGSTATGKIVTFAYSSTGSAKVANFTVTLTVIDNGGNAGSATTVETITDRPPTAAFTSSTSSALTGVSITFNATTSVDPDGAIADYTWTFGDGGTGTGAVVNHAYANTGSTNVENFTVSLTVIDTSGNTATTQSTVTITDRGPAASFTASSQSVLTNISVTFNATTSSDPDGAISAYFWSFGDGSNATGVVVSHSYANTRASQSMVYNVTLMVTDNSGSGDTLHTLVTVSDRPPIASFTESTTSVYTGVSIGFNATASLDPDGTITGYSWSFGDGHTDSGVLVSHSYATAGSFTVALTVTDNSGSTANASFVETILDRPPVVVLSSDSPTSLTLTSIGFNATGSFDPDGSIVGYGWNFGDGSTGSGIAVSHSYSKAGNYTVVLAVTDDSGGASSQTMVETILDRPPTASFTYTPSLPLAGETITYDASSSSDPDGTLIGFSWNFGDGSTGTSVTSQHAYATNGTFTVSLTATDDNGNVGTTITVITVGYDPAPTWPGSSSLQVTSFSSRTISLTWTQAVDSVQVSAYRLYVNGTELVTLPGSVTTYTVTGLNPLSHYLFQIQAGNPSGNYSNNGPSTMGFTHLQGDVNLDCRVDISDLTLVGASFGSRVGDTSYKAKADLNGDGVISIVDLVLVGANFGQTC